MVKHNKKNQLYAWVSSSTWLLCGMMALAAHAGEFYTIIGPDGRPMVIPRVPSENKKVEKTESKTSQTKQVESTQVVSTVEKKQTSQPQATPIVKVETVTETKPLSITDKSSTIIQPYESEDNPQSNGVARTAQINTHVETAITVSLPAVVMAKPETSVPVTATSSKETSSSVPEKLATLNSEHLKTTKTSKQVDRALNKIETNTALEKATRLPSASVTASVSAQSTSDGFLEIDGDRYVKNEYLEGQEFNLENKKRFYVMPEGVVDKELGSPRLQVVEREKGVNKGVLDRLFKSTQPIESSVITLSTQYYPIAKDQVVQSLGQACYSDKKIKKSKVLKAQQDVNLWPSQPLKDQFDYDVVAVQAGIKNVQLSSYASSQDQPSFYWPFVAFLDETGCVIEGVTGFKNQNREENKYRYAVMDGMLQLPSQTRYILMTPLLSAVDVEDQKLSNQGQIKLTAIR